MVIPVEEARVVRLGRPHEQRTVRRDGLRGVDGARAGLRELRVAVDEQRYGPQRIQREERPVVRPGREGHGHHKLRPEAPPRRVSADPARCN